MVTPRRTLVIGAGGGMSRGITERLGEAGHTVLCADVSETAAFAARDHLRARGSQAEAFVVDITDDASVTELQRSTSQQFGSVDCVVNAAGLLDRFTLVDSEIARFTRTIEVNLTGPFRVIRAFVPAMIKNGWGRIVNISSIAGVTGYPYPAYGASKAGLSNLTRSLVVDLWGSGVTANAICPGVVETPMVIEEVRRQVGRRVPTEKIIDPREIGGLVAFLLTDDAQNINGANLVLDGGATSFFQLFDRP